jgi:putative phosphoesterase
MSPFKKKIAFVSDLHIDSTKKEIIKSLKKYLTENEIDILCFAGDMCKNVKSTVKILKEIEVDCKIKVVAITGNHEMRDTNFTTSFETLSYFNQQLPDISLMNKAYEFDDWAILGHMGWYDFSVAPKKFNDYELNKMEYNGLIHGDKIYCRWNDLHHVKVADTFLKELKTQIEKYKNKNIILLSHIVPYKKYLNDTISEEWSYWNSFVGNLCIGHLINLYENIKIVHFGHTHERFYEYSNEKQVICAPLGYENEWSTKNIEEEIKKCVQILYFS